MRAFEKFCTLIRHSPWLEQADWLWDWLRPWYDHAVAWLGRHGLERILNGTDRILILPKFRGVGETYEPEVWSHLMAQARPGDIVADVGAHIGLYTIALANRVGPKGRVFAFEPDPENFAALKAHVALNGVSDNVELIQAAVGAHDGYVPFLSGGGSESRTIHASGNETPMVRCVRLDTVFRGRRVDILKIDVEGHEERVLEGTAELLRDMRRSPRVICIEVHPYAWPAVGTTSGSLLRLLADTEYRVFSPAGQPIQEIRAYGHILAYKANNGEIRIQG